MDDDENLYFATVILLIGTTVLSKNSNLSPWCRVLEITHSTRRIPTTENARYTQILAAFTRRSSGWCWDTSQNTKPKETSPASVIPQIDGLMARSTKCRISPLSAHHEADTSLNMYPVVLKIKNVNYVLIGCCSDDDILQTCPKSPSPAHILSIYEKSDVIGQSCQKLKDRSKGVQHFKEIELTTGLKTRLSL